MTLPTAAAPDEAAVSHCLLDVEGHVLSAAGAARPYYAASTIKLHVLVAALRAAEQGMLDLSAQVPATRTFRGADGRPFTLEGDHLDPTHPEDGEPVQVRELLTRMIDRSSNEATNHVLALLGLEAVAATIADLALGATRVERLIGDAAALAEGATNETSAADLATTMLAAVRPVPVAPRGAPEPLLAAASRELARDVFGAQQIPVIATALRDGVRWGSKSGWVDGYRHDVAFLGDPDGAAVRVLAVMTAGMAPAEADRRITGLVRTLLPDLTA